MNMSKRTEWDELSMAIGAKLAWFNRFICRGNPRLLYLIRVEVFMDSDTYGRFSEDSEFMERIRVDLMLQGGDAVYDAVCTYGFRDSFMRDHVFESVVTRFGLWEQEGIAFKIRMNPDMIPNGWWKRMYFSILN